MIICNKCGESIGEGMAFCANCGAPVPTSINHHKVSKRSTVSLILAIIACVCISGLSASYFTQLNASADQREQIADLQQQVETLSSKVKTQDTTISNMKSDINRKANVMQEDSDGSKHYVLYNSGRSSWIWWETEQMP